jgi:hypothetical protein
VLREKNMKGVAFPCGVKSGRGGLKNLVLSLQPPPINLPYQRRKPKIKRVKKTRKRT